MVLVYFNCGLWKRGRLVDYILYVLRRKFKGVRYVQLTFFIYCGLNRELFSNLARFCVVRRCFHYFNIKNFIRIMV